MEESKSEVDLNKNILFSHNTKGSSEDLVSSGLRLVSQEDVRIKIEGQATTTKSQEDIDAETDSDCVIEFD